MGNVAQSPTPILQFLNNAGLMNVGGSLLTQVGGVNYPTWQDAAGSIPLPNPIPLNSRGEISNTSGVSVPLYLAAGVNYAATLYDAGGNQIWINPSLTGQGSVATGLMTDEKGIGGVPGFVNGVDFVAGTTQSLTLSGFYGSASNLWVAFGAAEQGADSFQLSGHTLTFGSYSGSTFTPAPIPLGTSNIYVKGGTTQTTITTGSPVSTDLFIDAKDPAYGAIGNGVADDTAALQAAINAAISLGRRLFIPGGTYKVTAPLVINASGLTIFGIAYQATNIVASGNFQAVFQFNGAASYCSIRDLSVTQTGTTTPCVNIAQNAVVIRFTACYFAGNLTGDLVYSNGQNVDFDKCTWQLNSANTWGVNFDCFNQNCGITDCRFGGVGNGPRITNVFSPANNVQGLRIVDTYFINTGAYNVWLGNSFFTTIDGCTLDQSNTHALHVDVGAIGVTVNGSYFGSSVTTGVNVYLTAGCESIALTSNIHGYGQYGVVAAATVSAQINGLVIEGSIFQSAVSQVTPLLLDSVNNCNISNNTDITTASVNGSWQTKATFGPGNYNFSNNSWNPTATPTLYDANSHYRFVNERGLVGRTKGATTTGAATSLVVTHGCFTAPSTVLANPSANTGNWWINNVTATQFTINWATSTAVTFAWEADCSH
ncbi:glycosyl hydrolase family 28-related protein [Paraburkholderia sediminicola]|uniref:glycosyl hydrolase family 28-related protein n=1 Tax=Paraburkholderia sediminicola TaxID=458836 RepID=UPI0038B7C6AF